jgi:hypothetical protein
MQPREVGDRAGLRRSQPEASDKLLEEIRKEYQQSWSEVADFLRILEEMGGGSYKLTGSTQNPVFAYLEIF